PSGFDNTALLGKIAIKNGQPPILTVSMGNITNTALGPIQIKTLPAISLTKSYLRRNTARSSEVAALGTFGTHYVPLVKCCSQARAMHSRHLTMDQPRPIELSKNTNDSPRSMNIFHVVFWR